MKKALVCRYGAIGDQIMVTPLLRKLKESGYHVTVNCLDRASEIFQNNPNVDNLITQKNDEIPNKDLGPYWDKLKVGYDVFINLSGSIERGLLKIEGEDDFKMTMAERHAACNVNYYDQTLALGGYPEVTGMNGELYFTPVEESWAKMMRHQYEKRFVIVWSLSGSSYHKIWPHQEYAAMEFLKEHEDATIFTVGGGWEKVLEFNHPRAKKRCDIWKIRQSMIVAKYADLVIGPETGILNAAGCFNTPKILFLSHSTVENICKYWVNCYPMEPDKTKVPCYPCHQIHHTLNSCPLKKIGYDEALKPIEAPKCAAEIDPQQVYDTMDSIYKKWKEKQNDSANSTYITIHRN